MVNKTLGIYSTKYTLKFLQLAGSDYHIFLGVSFVKLGQISLLLVD